MGTTVKGCRTVTIGITQRVAPRLRCLRLPLITAGMRWLTAKGKANLTLDFFPSNLRLEPKVACGDESQITTLDVRALLPLLRLWAR